jgi:hypothetical protein
VSYWLGENSTKPFSAIKISLMMAPDSSLLKTYIAATAAAKHPVPSFSQKRLQISLQLKTPKPLDLVLSCLVFSLNLVFEGFSVLPYLVCCPSFM